MDLSENEATELMRMAALIWTYGVHPSEGCTEEVVSAASELLDTLEGRKKGGFKGQATQKIRLGEVDWKRVLTTFTALKDRRGLDNYRRDLKETLLGTSLGTTNPSSPEGQMEKGSSGRHPELITYPDLTAASRQLVREANSYSPYVEERVQDPIVGRSGYVGETHTGGVGETSPGNNPDPDQPDLPPADATRRTTGESSGAKSKYKKEAAIVVEMVKVRHPLIKELTMVEVSNAAAVASLLSGGEEDRFRQQAREMMADVRTGPGKLFDLMTDFKSSCSQAISRAAEGLRTGDLKEVVAERETLAWFEKKEQAEELKDSVYKTSELMVETHAEVLAIRALLDRWQGEGAGRNQGDVRPVSGDARVHYQDHANFFPPTNSFPHPNMTDRPITSARSTLPAAATKAWGPPQWTIAQPRLHFRTRRFEEEDEGEGEVRSTRSRKKREPQGLRGGKAQDSSEEEDEYSDSDSSPSKGRRSWRNDKRVGLRGGDRHAYPSSSPSSSSSTSDTEDEDRRGGRHDGRRPRRRNGRRDRSRNGHRERSREQERGSRRTLKPEQVGYFDPAKKEQTATQFLRRVKQMSRLYGRGPVLEVVPLCLRGTAAAWHAGLPERSQDRMAESLSEFEKQLLRRYAPDEFTTEEKANKLKFYFDGPNAMEIHDYVSEKVGLLADAGIVDENEVVKRLWKGLDAELQPFLHIHARGNRLARFEKDLYRMEPTARRLHDLQRKRGGGASDRKPKESGGSTTNAAKAPERNRGETSIPDKSKETPVRRSPPRPCRHCSGDHWDDKCPTRKKTTTAYMTAIEDGGWDSEDEMGYQVMQAKARYADVRKTSEQDSDSDSEAGNGRTSQ
ncbi:hypothetical protein DFH27DRAFT_524948 [Peziza echinospora]|nr:hypothetical protein DFH27DRAFT_524948 [Peziza echinospora]